MFLSSPIVGVGIMSGTSLDGIDVAVVSFPKGKVCGCRVLFYEEHVFSSSLASEVRLAMEGSTVSSALICSLNVALGEAFAAAVVKTLQNMKSSFASSSTSTSASFLLPSFVACHGQTIWHAPSLHCTLQLGEASVLLEHMPMHVKHVVSNFRAMDVAVGGQGAPLVPFFDFWAWGDAPEELCLANLGGIANVTLLGAGLDPIGFDTGPANVVVDSLCLQLLKMPCDMNGTVSSKGKVNRDVLAKMYHLGNSFLSQQSGPRSTGRELFGVQFSRAIVESFPSVDAADLIATAVEFTAETLWMAVRRSQRRPSILIVSGGGAKNPSIMSRLIALGNGCRVVRLDEWDQDRVQGLSESNKEAVAFCLLGLATLLGYPSNVPSVTGASKRVVLGQVCSRSHNFLQGVAAAVHETAEKGFELQVDAYNSGRPEYPLDEVRHQVQSLGAEGDVIDLGAGSGKLTKALVALGLSPLCVEPAAAMRQSLSLLLPQLSVVSGNATVIPASDNSCRAIFCGQAFHWFANLEALTEMHRVLRPSGRLVLIWNYEDESCAWTQELRKLYEKFEDGTFPQFAHGTWRNVWKTPEAATLFEKVEERVVTQNPLVTKQQCWDKIVSKSYISLLEQSVQDQLRVECFAVIDKAFAGQEKIEYPLKTLTFAALKK